ncbi:MAG TPA: CoA transferase [Candidatus Bathyarchaeia archaeon]|nr:CoA transferase [Candidatus Bathyarchaeia archaeon]
MSAPRSPQPFAGVTVIELGQFVAVPYAGQMLADGGAHVIKIEPREGEPSRHLAPLVPGESRHFLMRNRGKHSLPLELKHPDARAILDALFARADVVLTNLRPGLASELGLDYAQLAPRYPRLIVGNVSAFGARGPDAGLAGMDMVVQARSGLMVTNGRTKDGLPTTGESPVADYMAAALLSFGVASALYQRERTGSGTRVEASLLMAALVLQNNLMIRVENADGSAHARFVEWLEAARRDGVPFAEQVERMPRSRPVGMTAVYYRTYATKDAALAVACGSPSLRKRFIAAIGLDDPALESAIADEAALEKHYARLKSAAEAVVAGRTTAEWQALLEKAGVPASGVVLPVEALDAEQAVANGMIHRYDHAQLGPVTVLGAPLAVGDGGFAAGPPTPPFGSEVREILVWAGFAGAQLDRLVAGGAVSPRVP